MEREKESGKVIRESRGGVGVHMCDRIQVHTHIRVLSLSVPVCFSLFIAHTRTLTQTLFPVLSYSLSIPVATPLTHLLRARVFRRSLVLHSCSFCRTQEWARPKTVDCEGANESNGWFGDVSSVM